MRAARAAWQARCLTGLALLGGAATVGLGNSTSRCEPINVRAESAATAQKSLSKLEGMVERLRARVIVAPFVDHTLLAADATADDVRKLCMEAVRFGFKAVCVNGSNVKTCKQVLSEMGSNVKVCAVVGFPLGACTTNVKAYEAMQAIEDGASEVDMVINVGRVKSQDWDYVARDIAAVVNVCKQGGAMCKVIIETSMLNDEEKVAVSKLSALVGADFVKTSTGFSSGGATVDDVKLMKKSVQQAFEILPLESIPEVQVKASGGIKTSQEAEQMLMAGATRLGTSRASKWCSSEGTPAAPGTY